MCESALSVTSIIFVSTSTPSTVILKLKCEKYFFENFKGISPFQIGVESVKTVFLPWFINLIGG